MRLAKNKSKINCLKLGLKAFKAVLLCRLISLHRRNKTAVQGKSQSHNTEIVSHNYSRKESAIDFSMLKL